VCVLHQLSQPPDPIFSRENGNSTRKLKYLIAVVADKKVPLRRREERAKVKNIPVVDLGHAFFTTRHVSLFSVCVKVLRKKLGVDESAAKALTFHIFIGGIRKAPASRIFFSWCRRK
jgi:hypothetical protein